MCWCLDHNFPVGFLFQAWCSRLLVVGCACWVGLQVWHMPDCTCRVTLIPEPPISPHPQAIPAKGDTVLGCVAGYTGHLPGERACVIPGLRWELQRKLANRHPNRSILLPFRLPPSAPPLPTPLSPLLLDDLPSTRYIKKLPLHLNPHPPTVCPAMVFIDEVVTVQPAV